MKHLDTFINSLPISYYDELNNKNIRILLLNNPITFIEEYLKRGDKIPQELQNIFHDESSLNKFYHTASIYLLGIILYNNNQKLKEAINRHISTKQEVKSYNRTEEFLYSWFLASFFHDFGYSTTIKETIEEFIFGSKNKSVIRSKVKKVIGKLKDRNNVLPGNLLELTDRYDSYKQKYYNEEFIDHGFFSGTHFYNDRVKKYNAIRNRGYCVEKIGRGIYLDTITNLTWSRAIIKNIHLDVALVIIGHNIFFIKSNDHNKDRYYEFGIDELIIDKPIFKMNDYPLYFLLSFVDTVDIFKFILKNYPKKLSDKEIYEKVLKDVAFVFSDSSIEIEISFEGDLHELNEKFFHYIKGQMYWLPIKVDLCENKTIINIM